MNRLVRAGAFLGFVASALGCPAAAEPFNPDSDPSRIGWAQLRANFGPVPSMRGERFGVVLKTPTNEYWRMMAAGYRQRAAADGVKLDIQAAQSEFDQARQLSLLQSMVGSRYKALLISPISADNLKPAIDEATGANVPVIDVDGAVVDSVRHFVGPVNRTMGIQVANWFIKHHPAGGEVAVIEGQAGVLSTVQRSAGFRDTLVETGKFKVVASQSGEWDGRKAFEVATSIVERFPNVIGIYCNNDTMALGAVDALKARRGLDRVRVFGSDGTVLAYRSIGAGELAGTVDIFPSLIGEVGLEVAERVAAGQPIPRVVSTPQVLVMRDNMARYQVGDDARRRLLLDEESKRDARPAPPAPPRR